MEQYLPLVTLLVLAIAFCLISVLVSRVVAPKAPTAAKSAPYECGIVPRRDPPDRFPVRFYLVAMIFIIFDIEIIFLYPYAVVAEDLGAFGVGEIVVFAAAVFAAFVYLIGNGALDWGPPKRSRPVVDDGIVSATRTATTTVRRVGTEGREPVGSGTR
jgi:NADH-quinone oxidoreductase subunit A